MSVQKSFIPVHSVTCRQLNAITALSFIIDICMATIYRSDTVDA